MPGAGQADEGARTSTSDLLWRLAPGRAAHDSVSLMSRGLVLVIEDDEWVSRLLTLSLIHI